ncbi:MAG: RNA-protein complex protein Nop10 [Nanoarchaeota archaeon]|nr:RNA-protein complex protein Nop10 [Nanoarchaeota archaeon]
MRLLKCKSCDRYTMKEECPCGGKAVLPQPPKYSPQDKYARYRRMAKMEDRSERGLIKRKP